MSDETLKEQVFRMRFAFNRDDDRYAAVLELAKKVGTAEADRDRLAGLLEEARSEAERLKGLLHRDKTGLAAALEACLKRARAGQWISEGRGSYAWDEDDYRKETGWLVADIMKIALDGLHASGAVVDEAFHPKPGAALAAPPSGAPPAPPLGDPVSAHELEKLVERELRAYLTPFLAAKAAGDIVEALEQQRAATDQTEGK